MYLLKYAKSAHIACSMSDYEVSIEGKSVSSSIIFTH